MKALFCKSAGCCFLQLLITFYGYSQSGTVKGTVLDRTTAQPLPYASIYINSTTMGTFANDRGQFELRNIPPGDYDLIVSYIGHEAYQSRIRLADSVTVDITIKLALSTLKEIQITAKRDDNWSKQLEKFKRLFLGTGAKANLCRIINPWSLTFVDEKGTFSAKASEILEVENLRLGYRVSYELKGLTVSKDNYMISGFIRFRELETGDTLIAKRWAENRLKAYEGSTRHFFKSVIENRLKEEHYTIYEDRSELKQIVRNSRFSPNVDKTIFLYPMDGKVTTSMDSTMFTIQMPTRLEVHYKNGKTHSKIYWDVPNPVSWIEVQGGVLNVSEEGIVLNPIKMTLSGNMFDSRIADALPNDYKPEKKERVYQDPATETPTSALTYLTERPYLHTDKEYYYANEVIWFKGYMNYFMPSLADSLSRVLYVDLLDKNGKPVCKGIFPIEKGAVLGNLVLPSFINSGDHTLRAYTRWMLNFDPSFIFTKAIKVLGAGELARAKNQAASEHLMDYVVITSDKEQYSTHEKITLSVEVRDDLDQIVPANLSISVSDLAQAVPATNETTILNSFAMPVSSMPDTLDKKTRYLIQNGIDLKGKFIPPKSPARQGVLTLIQENANLEMTFTTEKDGAFFLPNLLLYDTARLSVASKTIKGKAGKVVFDTTAVEVPFRLSEPLQVEIYKSENSTRHYTPDFSKTQLLDPVTIKSTRLENKRTSVIQADYSVSGEWMEERHITDVLMGIQIKIPGLRVIIGSDADGFITRSIVMNGPSSFGGSAEPLIIIDDVVINDATRGPGGNAVDQISALRPSEIESVEVIKFGASAAYGARGGNGIIKIYTRRGPREPGTIPTGLYDKSTIKPVTINGFSETLKFTSPDYTSLTGVDIPDQRSTLYWNPLLKTDGKVPASVSFFAASVPATYRIVIEGLTAAGKTVRSEKRIVVTKRP